MGKTVFYSRAPNCKPKLPLAAAGRANLLLVSRRAPAERGPEFLELRWFALCARPPPDFAHVYPLRPADQYRLLKRLPVLPVVERGQAVSCAVCRREHTQAAAGHDAPRRRLEYLLSNRGQPAIADINGYLNSGWTQTRPAALNPNPAKAV